MDMDIKNHRPRSAPTYKPRPMLDSSHAPVLRVAQSHPRTHPSARQQAKDDRVTISIHFKLPDYSEWRVTKFAEEYPYLAIAIAIGAALLLMLLVGGLTEMWHAAHKLPAAIINLVMLGF